MTTLVYRLISTPIGTLRLLSDGQALVRIEFENQHGNDGIEGGDPVLDAASEQLLEYLGGARRQFDLPLAPVGTAFQLRVWDALLKIPFGELRNYRDIAAQLGNSGAVRAVGSANGRNPIPIVVPCHRVVGSDGRLAGYAGGVDLKRRLLTLEGLEVTR